MVVVPFIVILLESLSLKINADSPSLDLMILPVRVTVLLSLLLSKIPVFSVPSAVERLPVILMVLAKWWRWRKMRALGVSGFEHLAKLLNTLLTKVQSLWMGPA